MWANRLLFKHKTEVKLEHFEHKKFDAVSDISYAVMKAGPNERTELLKDLHEVNTALRELGTVAAVAAGTGGHSSSRRRRSRWQ